MKRARAIAWISASFGGGAGGADLFGGAEAAGAVEFEGVFEFGAGGDGLETRGEAGEGADLQLHGELEGVKQGMGGKAVDAGVDERVLDFHDGEHDRFGAFEDGEVEAGVLVHADGTAEADAAALAAIPVVVEVAEGLVAEGG
jgi:hypothetical protein